jgi:hypothetical protein
MKYRLIKNAYLTVIDSQHNNHFNRHFEVGTEFKRVGKNGNHLILATREKHTCVFVSREKLAECFENLWDSQILDGEF